MKGREERYRLFSWFFTFLFFFWSNYQGDKFDKSVQQQKEDVIVEEDTVETGNLKEKL